MIKDVEGSSYGLLCSRHTIPEFSWEDRRTGVRAKLLTWDLTITKSWCYTPYIGNESASSLVNDVHHYVIVRRLLDSLLNIRFEIPKYTRLFFGKAAYTMWGVPCFVDQDFPVSRPTIVLSHIEARSD
jgi:hypothetical protein